MSKNQIPRTVRAALLSRVWMALVLSSGLFFSGIVHNGNSSTFPNRVMAAQGGGGEKPVARLVTDARNAGQGFPLHELFESEVQSVAGSPAAQQAVHSGSLLKLRPKAISVILADEVPTLTLPLLNAAGRSVELELVKVDILTPDFAVFTSASDGMPVPFEKSAHYRGVVKGELNSLAAVSIFRNEVMGFYSTEKEGDFVLGKLAAKDNNINHILYAAKDLKEAMPFDCGTKDDGTPYTLDELREQPNPVISKCVRISVEADFDLYQSLGSDFINVINFVSGLLNQSAVLFANEGIPISLSELLIWTSPSPYTGNDSATLLNQYQSVRNSINGDFGHLINLKNVGGRAAGFDGFCNSNLDARQCISGIFTFFNNVPTYSWSVYVFTHEMGHLMGSRHTHACVWNGNGTAIDGCSGAVEGFCSLPPIPGGGGTVMSYCHLTGVGINFSLGIGPQPGNVIRSRYNSAGCLSSCTVDVARLQINLTNNSFVNSTGGAASFVVSPSGGRTVVRITLNPALNGFSRARFTVVYNGTPSAWTVNIGDSATNNGGGGDAATQSNDAEVQVFNTTMTALGKDGTPLPKDLVNVNSFAGSGQSVIFEVSNNFLGWSSFGGVGTLNSVHLFALNGQADFEGPVNHDIYAAFNRVIGDTSRVGSGVGSVTIDLLP